MSIQGTKEWMPNSRNRCDGCKNNCRYCYAMLKAVRYGRRTKDDWHIMRPLKVRQSTKKIDGGIMFPTTHDLHYKYRKCWFPFLEEMLENGNQVLIVSKPEYAAIVYIDQNLFAYQDQIEFRFTIGTNDDKTRQFWEPGAPSIQERIKCLNYVYEGGYHNSVSMEPLLMHNPVPFVKEVLERRVTGDIWIGLMNHLRYSDVLPEELTWYNTQFHSINSRVNIKEVYELLKNDPKIKWKDSIRDLLEL